MDVFKLRNELIQDYERYVKEAYRPGIEEDVESIKKGAEPAEIVAVGVDRLDYTKGIPQRLLAIERLLTKYPEYAGKFKFIQIGAPNREAIGEYQRIREEVTNLVRRINRVYSTGRWSPITFIDHYVPINDIIPYYKLADLCIVSSLDDGMNLVAKEFIASSQKGSLVLSEFTGASEEFPEAISINPYDIENFANAIKTAIEMPPEEKKSRLKQMKARVEENNIYLWARDLLSDLTSTDLSQGRL